MVHVSKSLLKLLAIPEATRPDALRRRNLNVPDVHGAYHKISALPVDRRWQSWNGALLHGGRNEGELARTVASSTAHEPVPVTELRQVHLFSPRNEVHVGDERVQEPIGQHLRYCLARQVVVAAPAHKAVTAESHSVPLALGPLARGNVPEDAVGVLALAILQEVHALWHAIRIILVQEIALLAFHA
jgi:hypothetical protein